MKRAEKREHLVQTAGELFNQFGFHATGIDRIIARSGVAKTTLYRHFDSKDELIVAVLRRIDERFRDDMRRAVNGATDEPEKRVLSTFDFLEGWFLEDSFHGCPFMCAASEYSEELGPVFQEARLHKRLLEEYFEKLVRAAKLKNPKRLAGEINILHEGATAVAHISREPGAARKARAACAKLIKAARK